MRWIFLRSGVFLGTVLSQLVCHSNFRRTSRAHLLCSAQKTILTFSTIVSLSQRSSRIRFNTNVSCMKLSPGGTVRNFTLNSTTYESRCGKKRSWRLPIILRSDHTSCGPLDSAQQFAKERFSPSTCRSRVFLFLLVFEVWVAFLLVLLQPTVGLLVMVFSVSAIWQKYTSRTWREMNFGFSFS